MNTLKLFIASTTKEEERTTIKQYVSEANIQLKKYGYNYEFEAIIYGETPIADERDAQKRTLNKEARESYFFILLAINNQTIGEFTIEEYKNALIQANNSPNKHPLIKVFLLKDKKDDPLILPYKEEENNKIIEKENFETRLYNDYGGYVQHTVRNKFKDTFIDYLVNFIRKDIHRYRQNNLSYKLHIDTSDQKYREIKKYFRREKIDDRIEEIAQQSSLIILEGNTYSGKTRAIYEFMSHNTKWHNHNFYIYRGSNNCTIQNLNDLTIDMSSDREEGDVHFIDDFNDIISGKEHEINRESSFWSTLCSISNNSFPIWGKTTIILTISGKLSHVQKNKLYKTIFGEAYLSIKNRLKDLTVNLDVFDKQDFRIMVNDMVREGYITKERIRPGNYTIGSLYINNETIRETIKDLLSTENSPINLLRTLKLHWMFSSKDLRGDYDELEKLYEFIASKSTQAELNNHIDILRQKALLISEMEEGRRKIIIDNFIIEAISDVVNDRIILEHEDPSKISETEKNEFRKRARHEDLQSVINYAKESTSNNSYVTDKNHLRCIEHLGYLLCDRNDLCDEDIFFLIKHIYISITGKLIINEHPSLTTYTDMLGRICFEKKNPIYSQSFCVTAISRLHDFSSICMILNIANSKREKFKNKNEQMAEAYETVYKGIVYAMFSAQKSLTLEQENIMASYIFNENNDFILPFRMDDLKQIHILKRMIPYLNYQPLELIERVKEATLNFLKEDISIQDKYDNNNDGWEDDDEEEENAIDDIRVEKILLPQIRGIVISAMQKTKKHKDFSDLITKISTTDSKYLKQAITSKYANAFYKEITNIASQYTYEDRKAMFDWLLNINDAEGPMKISIENITTTEFYREKRIQTLNAMIELLDENEALNAYHTMKSRGLCDSFTFSMLIKNEFLGFEHLYHLIDTNNQKENNFLTQNQMLQKAETLSDAHTCLLLMGINDNDPSKLRDEYALGNYLSIKQITAQMCIDIIKKWHNRNNKKILSEKTIGVILKKFSYKGLKDLFDESSTTRDNCFTKYGLYFEEIEIARKNVICLNYLFLKGNNKNDAEFLKAQFEKLLAENSTHNLVVNWQDNENTSILSSYMKIHNIFPTYKNLKEETDKLFEKYKDTLRKTHYTYAPLLWKIIKESKTEITTETAIEKINKTLVDAYKYFSRLYARKEVIQHMSHLYNYRLRLLKQEDYHIQLPYAYEDEIIKCTLSEYLDKLLQENTSYADGTFIFYVLKSMKEVDETIYNKISEIAQQNRKGINLDTLDSNKNKEKQEERLAEEIRKKIISFENGEINIDENIIHIYSPIKLLWWLLKNGEIKYEHAKVYLSEHRNVKITQTYVNFAFKVIEKEYRYSKNGYKKMQELLKETEGNSTLYRSIEMFLSMLKATNNESELEETIKTFPNEYCKKPEYIDTYIRKHISFHHKKNWEDPNSATILLDKLTQIIRDNIDFINITIVNSYLFGLMEIIKGNIKADDSLKNEVSQTMQTCWTYLKKNGNINLGILFNNTTQILEADVQTYSFFPIYCSEIIHEMNVRFKCDFHYGYDKKKNCLYDTLKNYAFFYTNMTIRPSENDFNHLIEILENKRHQEIRREIYDNYILNTHENLDEFWFILLRYSDLMCKEVIDLFKYKNKEFTVDLDRINELHLIYMDKKEQSNDWQEKIDEIYSKVSLKNKKLYEDIFK